MKTLGKLFKNKVISVLMIFMLTIVFVQVPQGKSLGASSGSEGIPGKSIIIYSGSPLAYVNGVEKLVDSTNPDVEVVSKNGTVFVPIRFIMDYFDADIKFDSSYSFVTVTSGKKSAVITISNNKLEINGVELKYDYPVEKMHGKIFVPLRKIMEDVLEKDVFYYKGVIVIKSKGTEINPEKEKDSLNEYLKTFTGKNEKIPILMYHHFQDNIPENLYDTMVTPKEFEEHLSYLKKQGYHPITFEQLAEYLQNDDARLPVKPYMITMDDGYTSNYQYAYPLLKKYNARAVISIVTSTVGQTPGLYQHFSWEQAKEMESSGLITIANHGLHHSNHQNLTEEELVESVTSAQQDIENHLGKRRISIFTYPGGACNEDDRRILAGLGFNIQLTGFGSLVDKQSDLSDIRRIPVKHGMMGKDIDNLIESMKKPVD